MSLSLNAPTLRRHNSCLALLAMCVVVAALSSGCAVDVFQDSISTRVDVPAANTTEVVSESKRFRFERDVSEAQGAVLHRAWIQVEAPENVDLSFVAWVDVYAIDPTTGERVHVIRGDGFKPGERRRQLEIVFGDDVRHFVQDRRVSLEWEVQPNVLYRQEPDAPQIGLRFGIVLEVET